MSSTESATETTSILSPPKKRQSRALSRGEKEIILNTFKSQAEDSGNFLNATTSEVVRDTAYKTGTSERSIYRVVREYKTQKKLKSPKKPKKRKNVLAKIDDFDRNAIRRKVHEFYFRNELPTIDRVLKNVNNDEDLPNFCRSTFYNLLKELNFRYVKRGRDSALTDRNDIVLWRRKYLETIRVMRQSGKKIYYMDETWVNAGHTKSYLWKDETVKSAKQAFLAGLSTGNKAPTGKGGRLIIIHIGSDTGFVDGGLRLFESRKKDDYHLEMDGDYFENWFSEILPLLEENSVIVLDNASYHSRKLEKVPNTAWRKENIKSWLLSKHIPFENDMLKAQLLQIVNYHKEKYNLYVIDELAKSHNRTVLRLPPYHCELNPIELVWAQLKNFVSSNNKTFKISDVKELCAQAVTRIKNEQWKKCVAHVTDVIEPKLWKLDNIMEVTTERLIINLSNSSDSSSDYFDSSSEN